MARRTRAAEAAAEPPPCAAAVEVTPPAAIRITAHHGFIDQSGVRQMWTPGQVVSEPETIALLIARGARHEPE